MATKENINTKFKAEYGVRGVVIGDIEIKYLPIRRSRGMREKKSMTGNFEKDFDVNVNDKCTDIDLICNDIAKHIAKRSSRRPKQKIDVEDGEVRGLMWKMIQSMIYLKEVAEE